jgi:exopolysaccharide biosynthesis polyprenyl glycosylphosphotransferase
LSPSLLKTRHQKTEGAEWAARLIPGVAAEFRGSLRKQPRSVRPKIEFSAEEAWHAPADPVTKTFSETALGLILPNPLKTKDGGRWLRLMAADFTLVGLNWLFVGALSPSAQTVPIRVRLFEQAIGPLPPSRLLGIALLHAGLITMLGYSEGLYARGHNLRQQAQALGKATLWATGLLCVSYQMQGARLSMTAVVCGAGLLNFCALFAWRWTELQRERRVGKRGCERRNVLIVGAGGVGRRLAAHVETHPEEGRVISGFLDDERALGNGIIGEVSSLARLARKGFVDEVILAAPHDRGLTLRVLHEARRLRLDVKIIPDLFGCQPAEPEVERLGNLPVICLRRERIPVAGLFTKRIVDVLGASIALLFLAPLLIAVAALIKLDSNGRVIYAAQRAGRKGRLFRCYKFRTMVSNADALKNSLRLHNQRSGAIFKITDDPRITRLGRLLRRFSLDELPQFWNVLKGEMSLVGPRPHPLDDFVTYQVEDLARLDVTPGITGLWQVTARRDPSFHRSVELDREYIRTWNLGLDAKILLKTIVAVVRGSGD